MNFFEQCFSPRKRGLQETVSGIERYLSIFGGMETGQGQQADVIQQMP